MGEREERNERIRELYRGGMLIKDIAASVGMKAHSVGHILKKMGEARPAKPQKRWKEVDEAGVVARWDEGLSTSAIAERYGIGVSRVVEVLKGHGREVASAYRHRYDGEGGTIDRSRNAFARIARRT